MDARPIGESEERLFRALQHLRRYVRQRRMIEHGVRWVWAPTSVALAVQLYARFVPLERADVLSIAVPCLLSLLWLVWELLRPLSLAQVALQMDIEAHLKERLTTALDLIAQPPQNRPPLAARQIADAADHAERLARTARHLLPPRLTAYPPVVATVLLLATALLWWLPNPQDAILAERRAVRAAARAEAERLDAVREALTPQDRLPPPELEAVLQELDRLAAELRANPGDLEEALADIEAARAALEAQVPSDFATRQNTLQTLSRQMESASRPNEPATGDLQAAAQALRDLAARFDTLSPPERAELANMLREQAAAVAPFDPDLAADLNATANALIQNDLAAAQESAQAAAQRLEAADSALHAADAAQRAAEELDTTRRAVASAAQRAQAQAQANGATQGAGGQNSTTGQNGQGSAGGQNSSQGQGQARGAGGQGAPTGSGGGSLSGQLPGGTRQGQFTGSDPNRTGPGALEGAYQPGVFAPVLPTNTNKDTIEGSLGDEGTNAERLSLPDTGVQAPALVPLESALPAYAENATRALEQEQYPPHLRTFIQQYFTALGGQP
nr:hypothetical protein [Ardenticatena sp.]